MLDTNIQKLINKISETATAHLKDDSERIFLERNWEFIFGEFDGWCVLQLFTRGSGAYWIYPMLYPAVAIDTLKAKLPSFSFSISGSGYGHVMSGGEHWLEPFWDVKAGFEKSEVPLFFRRRYYGYPPGKEGYVEFNQLVTHPLGLHWSPQRNSYCVLNDLGEEIEKIKLVKTAEVDLILIRRATLDKLLHLGKWDLVRYFCLHRWKGDHLGMGDKQNEEVFEPETYEGKFEIRTSFTKGELNFVEFRGAQIEHAKGDMEKLLAWDAEEDEEEGEKKYASFIVDDWKNKRLLKDYSITPSNFANYFTQSELPFETSPIFFKAEVLDKYKNNPDKYDLDERSINCRGGWHLETFDVNEHNQVHTYAIYLARLPYKEQLHWAQYNESPKGAISKRAIQTDFEAKFPDTKPKIDQLKDVLHDLLELRCKGGIGPFWNPKGGSWENASKGLYYVNTENPNQWQDFVIALANTTNEGFVVGALRTLAETLGKPDPKLGSLGLLRFVLENSGHKNEAATIHGVLNDLQKRRSTGKAHGTWEKPEGSLIADADKRLTAVIEAISQLVEIFRKLGN